MFRMGVIIAPVLKPCQPSKLAGRKHADYYFCVNFFAWLGSSVGKKQVVGLTGFGIALFAVLHMSGNLVMLVSPQAYNMYGHQLVHNPVFPALEALLLLAFVFHVVLASQLWFRNRAARPRNNSSAGSGAKRSSFAARSMILSGLLLFVFLVLHLITFKYGAHYTVVYNGVEVRDLYRLIQEKFHSPLYVAWYVFSLVVMGVHLSHGIASLFQSMGIAGVRNAKLQAVSIGIATVLTAGFILQPLWIMFGGGQ